MRQLFWRIVIVVLFVWMVSAFRDANNSTVQYHSVTGEQIK